MDYPWQNLAEKELLELRLCDLGLRLEGSLLEPVLLQVSKELQRRKINFKPGYWISDEWFCPDGVAGVAIPFYLFHPRLKELEERFAGVVEGNSKEELLKLLRHELGHAIDNAYGLRRSRRRQKIFGSSQQAYPQSYKPRLYSRKYVDHLGDGYAQSHPDEDFAETFAVWMTPRVSWNRKYKAQPSYLKLKCMEGLMNEIRHQTPKLLNSNPEDDISELKMSLREYLLKRKRQKKNYLPKTLDIDLKSIFSADKTSGYFAHDFIRRQSPEICRELAQSLGAHKYELKPVLSLLERRSQKLQLFVKDLSPETRGAFRDIVVKQTLDFINSRRDRIYL